MASEIRFVDFSLLHLTGQEKKTLRSVCDKPRRIAKSEDYEVYERLAELGLIESYASGDSSGDTKHSVFPTEMGKEYLAYSAKAGKRRVTEIIKWVVPVMLSVLALVLSIRANTGVSTAAGTTRTTAASPQAVQTTGQSNTNAQPAAQSSAPAQQAPAAANSSPTGNAAQQSNSKASGEPGASGEASNG